MIDAPPGPRPERQAPIADAVHPLPPAVASQALHAETRWVLNRAEAWPGSWRGWVRVTAGAVPPVRQPVTRSPPLRVTGRAGRLPARTRSPAPSRARRSEHRGPACTEVRVGPICVLDPDRIRRGPSACRSRRLCCIGASRRGPHRSVVRRVRPCRQRLFASRSGRGRCGWYQTPIDFKALLHRRVRSVGRRCQLPTPYTSMGFVPLRGLSRPSAA